MRRRDFIGAVVGAATMGPLAAFAQQPGGIRRISVLSAFPENDAETRDNLQAFRSALEQFGWIDGSNVRIDCRSTFGDAELVRKCAAEVVALAPDAVLAVGGGNSGTDATTEQQHINSKSAKLRSIRRRSGG
jgi:putative tryptophan/tyrosine transport system substrate-binding protein